MTRIPIHVTIVVFILTAFTACGGGGSSGGDSDRVADNLNASLNCTDSDGDGYTDSFCGSLDCDDTNPGINPVVREICGDNIDQNCDGRDEICSSGASAHAGLTWDGSPSICLSCHSDETEDMYTST